VSPPAGLPHSAIQGSSPVCGSPWLIAAYHGLPRLRVPRHPPHTFARLTTSVDQAEHARSTRVMHFDVRSAFAASARPLQSPDDDSSSTITSHVHCQTALANAPRLPQAGARDACMPVQSKSDRDAECRGGDFRALSIGRSRGIRSTRGSGKEVIQPQVPLRLPCYDFAPVTWLAFGRLPPCGLLHGLRALQASMA
jgi:hypothetical protein